MAMLITRFHKLIQSKVIWYIFLAVIVVSFVGFFTPSVGSAKQRKAGPAGELYGKKISRDEFQHSWRNAYIWQVMMSGRMLQMNEQMNAALRQEAWQRVAILRKAEAEKTVVSNKEVIDQIQRMPLFFSQAGSFDPNVYKAVLQQIGLTPRQAEELFREQLVIHRHLSRPAQAALVSPYELKKAYQLYTDRFVLDYALISRADVAKTVSVSKEEAQALFAANPEAFRMPAKVRVSYVEFSVSNYLAKAVVPEGAALQVYNRNIDSYRIENTNAAAAVEYKPFESVESEITRELKQATARKLAVDAAAGFVADVAPKAEGARPDFAGVAKSAGLKVKSQPAFGPKDDLKGIDAAAPFKQAALALNEDAYSCFSDPVAGKDSVYVLSLDQRYPSFVPTFEIVEKEVMERAREQAVAKALADRALEVEKAVNAALKSGIAFKAAVQPLGLKVTTTDEFDYSTELKDPHAQTLVSACLNVKQGGLCEPAPVKDGVLIAYVASRKPAASADGFEAIREELAGGLGRSRAQRLTASWQEALLRDGKLKDLMEAPQSR